MANEMIANAFNCVFITSLLVLLNVIDIRDPKDSFVRQETTCEFAHCDGAVPVAYTAGVNLDDDCARQRLAFASRCARGVTSQATAPTTFQDRCVAGRTRWPADSFGRQF